MAELRFDGRVAVVTGGARGLGKAYAMLLGSRGARVVVNDSGTSQSGEGFDPGPAEEVARSIREAGGEAVACAASVATAEGGRAVIDAAMSHYGRIDSLVHSAGISRPALLRDMRAEDFEAVVSAQLHGAFHVVRAAFPIMCDAGFGRIVLTSSIGGIYGKPRVAGYGVANAGVIGLANVAALEGATAGVKCNIILPGALTRFAEGTDTSGHPPMSTDMVAPMVAWLAHEACSISGELLVSIAGRYARAFIGETPGIFREHWSIEEVDAAIDAIRDVAEPMIFPVVPLASDQLSARDAHIRYSFAKARAGEP